MERATTDSDADLGATPLPSLARLSLASTPAPTALPAAGSDAAERLPAELTTVVAASAFGEFFADRHPNQEFNKERMHKFLRDAQPVLGNDAVLELESERLNREWVEAFMAARKAGQATPSDDAFLAMEEKRLAMRAERRAAYPDRKLMSGVFVYDPTGVTMMLPYFRRPKGSSGKYDVAYWIGAPRFWSDVTAELLRRTERGAKTPMGTGTFNTVWCVGLKEKTARTDEPHGVTHYLSEVSQKALKAPSRASVLTQWAEVFGAEDIPAVVALRVQMLAPEGAQYLANGQTRATTRMRDTEALKFAIEYLMSAYAMQHGFGPKIYLAGRFRDYVQLVEYSHSAEEFVPRDALRPRRDHRPCRETETGAGFDPARFLQRRVTNAPPSDDAGQVFWVMEHFTSDLSNLVAEYVAHEGDAPAELWAEISLMHVKAAKAHFLHVDTKLENMLCNATAKARFLLSPARNFLVPGSVRLSDFDQCEVHPDVSWDVLYVANTMLLLATLTREPTQWNLFLAHLATPPPSGLPSWAFETHAFWRYFAADGNWQRYMARLMQFGAMLETLRLFISTYWGLEDLPGDEIDMRLPTLFVGTDARSVRGFGALLSVETVEAWNLQSKEEKLEILETAAPPVPPAPSTSGVGEKRSRA